MTSSFWVEVGVMTNVRMFIKTSFAFQSDISMHSFVDVVSVTSHDAWPVRTAANWDSTMNALDGMCMYMCMCMYMHMFLCVSTFI